MMKPLRTSPQSGFAVLLVMVVITALSILAGALAIFMKVESQLAQNTNDSEDLYWAGRGGVERACWILAMEPPGVTSLKQKWAGGPGDGPETNGPLINITLKGYPVGHAIVDLSMEEQESKFNINTADTPLLNQVLTTMGADASDISVVSDSIQDWIDPDDATRPAGAESDYYQGLMPSYYAKNAPIDNIEELQLIKGITPEMFKGGGGDPNSPFKHHHLGFGRAPGQAAEYPFGLRDVFTPYSNGKVNLNTADVNVLSCIPNLDTNVAEAIKQLRNSEGGAMAGSGVLHDFNQLREVLPNPALIQQIQRYCTFGGNTYKVTATARIGSNSQEFIAIIMRNGLRTQIVSFHPK